MNESMISIPSDLDEELKAIAQRLGRTRAEVVREALTAYVEEQERPWPKSIGSGANGTIGGADSEDWLRENWKPDW